MTTVLKPSKAAVDLEVCVDTIDGAMAAQQVGAARVELCAALSEGGLTPSAGLMSAAATLDIPCYAMIRPRSGLFHFNEHEVRIMRADIKAAREAGLAGVVLGVQQQNGELDTDLLEQLCDDANGLGTTLHRVIDVVPDPLQALEQAISLGFERVLTSGAQPEAPQGVELIRTMVQQAGGRISVMPGCGLTADNVAQLVADTGVREVHAACLTPVSRERAFSDFDPPNGRMQTSGSEVQAMVAAITG
jgi:copper homeostasis protein